MTSKYQIITYFKGDPENVTGPRCQFRRYVAEVFIENTVASKGEFKLTLGTDVLYLLGNVPIDGINATVTHSTDKKSVIGPYPMPKENPDPEGDPYYGRDVFVTHDITLSWSSDHPIDATAEKKLIAKFMLTFGRWGMEYSEIESRESDDILTADKDFTATADGEPIAVSTNNYIGIVPHEPPQMPPEFDESAEKGELITRFALLSDTHVGVRQRWKDYEWLHGVFNKLEEIHTATPFDFVVQLGDTIDDGYANTYKTDYETYLEEIKYLKLCDPVHPLEGRAEGKLPHYELRGNHDTAPDLRFFKNKLWYSGNDSGKKVAFVSFFANYGGYPLVNFNVAGNYNSYRSYGVLRPEMVDFVEKSVIAAKEANATHVILLSHFGISQDVGAPILPESGLGRIQQLCKKHGITLCFNGHEHNKDFTHRMLDNIHDFDVSMLKDAYAVVEIYEGIAKVDIYKTVSNTLWKTEYVNLK